MEFLISALGIIGIFTFGFFLADILLGRKSHILERVSVGFLLGSGLFTFVLFLANWKLNIPFGKSQSLITLLVLNVFSFLLNIFTSRKRRLEKTFDYNFNIKDGFRNLNRLEKIIIGLILFLFISSLANNIYWPISDWDALALYDFRAKVFLVDTSLVQAALSNGYFIQYPLYTSLLHLFAYQLGVLNPKFFYSFIYLSLIIIFYFSLERQIGRPRALFFSLVFAFSPIFFAHSMMAYTNLPYSAFICAGVFYLYEWTKRKGLSTLILSSFLVGLSTWSRISEPFWLATLFLVLVFSIKRKKIVDFFVYGFFVLLLYKSWSSFMSFILLESGVGGISVNYFKVLGQLELKRFVEVFEFLYNSVFLTWRYLYLLFILSFILGVFRNKLRAKSFYFVTFLFLFLLFVGTLIFSYTFVGWKAIPDSARRMSMFFEPLLIYTISCQLAPYDTKTV